MNNRNEKYKNLTLFVSPERLKADLALIRRKYDETDIHPIIINIIDEYEQADQKLNIGNNRP